MPGRLAAVVLAMTVLAGAGGVPATASAAGRYVAIGDSIAGASDSYVDRFAARLGVADPDGRSTASEPHRPSDPGRPGHRSVRRRAAPDGPPTTPFATTDPDRGDGRAHGSVEPRLAPRAGCPTWVWRGSTR